MSASFVHLRVHSAYSLLKGAVKIPKLIALCREYQMPAVALTDHDNLFGALEFSQAAMKEGIQPIIGLSASLVPWGASSQNTHKMIADELLLYAKDEEGFTNLLALASKAYLDPALASAPLLSYEDVERHSKGLIALSAGMFGAVGKMFLANRAKESVEAMLALQGIFANRFYMELMRHKLPMERLIERPMIDMAIKHNIPLVATNNVYFSSASMYEAHDALMCVSAGRYISEPDRPKLTPDHRFKSSQEMQLLFRDIPEAIENTTFIAQRCHVFSPTRSPILPGFAMKTDTGEVLSESDALRIRARDGLEDRLNNLIYTEAMDVEERETIAKPYRDRLEYELDVIITMKFPGYFLIVSDFITWSKKQHIPVGPGRGSGAGSVVAWVLLITDLDPLRYGLIFERFLNPERVSMPDFDIDFCQERRDEVIKYVQDKYGVDRVAQIITFGKLQARAVLRDVGRVMQMPYSQVDRISKLVPNNPAAPVTLEEAIKVEPLLRQAIREDEQISKMVDIAKQLEGLYRHASTHAAGLVIGDRPLEELAPLYRDPKSSMPVIQYSMKYAEAAGLVKFDFLGLKTLTVLQKTVEFLAHRHIHIDLLKLPVGDKATYALLGRGDAVGVFQFESQGMQDALRKLKPDCIEDLIALGALYRPGPMDNIPTYIARKHGKEKPDYLHPMLTEVLRETYGVIIYQEQVQKIAQVMSGYTLGGADLLRRAMGKKIKEEMDAQRAQFVEGAKANGVSEAQASSIFELVAKFAGYGFNKSHAAAYAVIAYQTAYLKANYPVEFIAASMIYDMGTSEKLSVLHQEAKKMQVKILPPDINCSKPLFSVELCSDGTYAIRYALAAIRNVGAQAMEAIVATRETGGAFKDIFNFAQRVDANVLNRRQLEYMIMAGCFDTLHSSRRQLYESLDRVLAVAQTATQDRQSNQINLFAESAATPYSNNELKPVEEWSVLEKLNKECDAIGFYLSAHPMESYAPALKKWGITNSGALPRKLNGSQQSLKLAGIVAACKTKVSSRGKFAFLSLSDAEGFFEVTIYDESILNVHHNLLEAGTPLIITVNAKMDDNGARMIVQKIEKLEEEAMQHTHAQLVLTIKPDMPLDKLKSLLGAAQPKGTQIDLRVEIGQGIVTMRLKSKYKITSDVCRLIESLPHVELKAA